MFLRFVFSASVDRLSPFLLRPCMFLSAAYISSDARDNEVRRDRKHKFLQSLGDQKIKIKTKLRSVRNFSKENILTLPNAISVCRLLVTPALGYLIIHGEYVYAVGTICYSLSPTCVGCYLNMPDFRTQSADERLKKSKQLYYRSYGRDPVSADPKRTMV